MLEKLRAKSDRFKQSFSLAITIIVFSGVVFVWFSSWDARNTENETRDKTVAPLEGISAMLDGFQLSLKDMMSGMPTFIGTNGVPVSTTTLTVATSSNDFDLSGVVVIDPAGTSTSSKTTH